MKIRKLLILTACILATFMLICGCRKTVPSSSESDSITDAIGEIPRVTDSDLDEGQTTVELLTNAAETLSASKAPDEQIIEPETEYLQPEATEPATMEPDTTEPATSELESVESETVICYHESSNWDVVLAATCLQDGQMVNICTTCNKILNNVVIPATGHIEITVMGVAPTCTEAGLTDGSRCGICGEIFIVQKIIPAVGHNEVEVRGTAASCENSGLTNGVKCLTCNKILISQAEIPPTGHVEMSVVSKAATCIEPGLTVGTVCQTCGKILTAAEIIPATGHTEIAVAGKAATCTETGLTEGTVCQTCGEILIAGKIIPVTSHTEVVLAGKAPTCTEGGLTASVKCGYCGEILIAQQTTPATGHVEIAVAGRAATCAESGLTEGTKCLICGEIVVAQKTIPVTDHAVVTIEGKAATCTEDGYTASAYCSACRQLLQLASPIEARGHTIEILPRVEPTQTATGLTEGKKCRVCSAILVEQQTIPQISGGDAPSSGNDPSDDTPSSGTNPPLENDTPPSGAVLWDGSIADGFAGGNGTASDPYRIANGEQLAYLAKLVNVSDERYAQKYYCLTGNIDLGDREWTPIGVSASCGFDGYLDGRGYTISNLTITAGDASYAGLFGNILGGTVEDLEVTNVLIRASGGVEVQVGGLAGCSSGTVRRCSAQGTVYATATEENIWIFAGGLIGSLRGGSVDNCYADCGVEVFADQRGVWGHAGGLVGYVANGGTVGNSYARGNATATIVGNLGCSRAGGLCGELSGGAIQNCLAIGNVSAQGTFEAYADGLACKISGNNVVTNCYRLADQIVKSNGMATPSAAGNSCTKAQLNQKSFYTMILAWSAELWNLSGVNSAVGICLGLK